MPHLDYSKTNIYKICCNNSAVKYVFVGATLNFRIQKSYHHRRCNAKVECEPYLTINSNGGWNNWKMILLEEFTECSKKSEMKIRVGEWENRLKNGILTPFDSGLTPFDSKLVLAVSDLTPFDSDFRCGDSDENMKKCEQNAVEEQHREEDKERYICNLCKKTFTRKNNLHRHMKDRCRKYHELELENKSLKAQLRANQTSVISNKTSNHNIHNTTNTNTNSHNTTNTVNTVNNYIVSFGQEDFSKIYNTKKKKLAVLNQKHSALLYRIEQSRCNKKHPEFRNVVIKNLRSDVVHVYKDTVDPHNFIVMSTEDVLDRIMTNDYNEIENDFENIGHELDDTTRERTGEFIRQMNQDPNVMKQQKQSVKRMIYNMNKDVKIKDVI